MIQPRSRKLNRKGVLVVVFAIVLPVMLIILGFTIDYANIQRVRNEIRVVADLSAKAAAAKLSQTHDPDQAIVAAKAVASANFVCGNPLQLDTSDITFGHATRMPDGSIDFSANVPPFNGVQISAERMADEGRGINLFFGSLYGREEISLAQTATAAFQDVDILLVLDRSGSMKWKTTGDTTPTEQTTLQCLIPNAESRWHSLDEAVTIFLNTLQASPVLERVGLVTFSSDFTDFCGTTTIQESTLDQALTSNQNAVRSAMSNYKVSVWGGATNIFAGLHQARLHMEANKTPGAEHVIVLLTDGVYNVGPAPFDEATACKNAGFTLHTITFSDDANQDDMLTTALNGGGNHHHASTEEELKRVFETIAGSFAILTE